MKQRCLLIWLCLAALLLSPSFLRAAPLSDGAAQQEALSKVLPLVKEKVQLPERFTAFTSSFQVGSEVRLSLEWQDADHKESISVVCNDQGVIQSYRHYVNEGVRMPTLFDYDEVRVHQQAWEAVQRLFPEIVDELCETPIIDTSALLRGECVLRYDRLLEGIPVQDQYVTVRLNTQGEGVRSLERQWTASIDKLQSVEEALSEEEAQRLLREKIDLDLVYNTSFRDPHQKMPSGFRILDSNHASDPYLVYRLPSYPNEFVLDAVSGEPERKRQERQFNQTYPIYIGYPRQAYRGLLDSTADVLNTEKLVEKFMSLEALYLDADARLEKVQYAQDAEGKPVALLTWLYPLREQDIAELGLNGPDENRIGYEIRMEAVLDARSGELLYFARSSTLPEPRKERQEREALSDAELKALAEAFLAEHKPVLLQEARFFEEGPLSEAKLTLDLPDVEDRYLPSHTASYRWIRCPQYDFEANDLLLTLDIVTGKVVQFQQNWPTLTFAAPDIISEEEALSELMQACPPQLRYRLTTEESGSVQAELCYVVSSHIVVDAHTGTPLQPQTGLAVSGSDVRYADLEGSALQAPAELLSKLGIFLLEGDRFDPHLPVSQQEFLRVTYALFNYQPYGNDAHISGEYRDRGIIDDDSYDPAAVINAGQALKILLRLDGHEAWAELPGIFKAAETIPVEFRGYLALAQALGIVPEGRAWQAEQALTRADLVELIYRFLRRS